MLLLRNTLRSAGAQTCRVAASYKHLVSPGPKAMFQQHTIIPLPASGLFYKKEPEILTLLRKGSLLLEFRQVKFLSPERWTPLF
jgi:hypothetical protein